jgi:hypothetical protein
MLISMPTGTSTIFGVFQAILALLVKPDELRPAHKVIRKQKFASEIFFTPKTPPFLCCNAKIIHGLVRSFRQTNDGSMGSYGGHQNAGFEPPR